MNILTVPKVMGSILLSELAHAGVKRKWSDLPYSVHPRNVFLRVIQNPVPSQDLWVSMACAALLHDTVEDCLDKYPDIEDRILRTAGEDALNLVLEVTNPQKNPKISLEERQRILSLPRSERKRIDREHIAKASIPAKVLKVYDRLENLQDVEKCPDNEFIVKYVNESELLLDVLKDTPGVDKEIKQIDEKIKFLRAKQ